ncbi:uncharacterized protein BDZ99DRAFT_493684 [Mytilinidion resinicola]|uniref:Uncharacterized protein n=1 Tax=Mytilinidion resinicola TaxID=574789 RepID=A0A6A6Z4N2_9PEZI|nr:uncharacterized protein BDZ99DRAFT_493684 [Mytilinidion resinicola]KAF2815699.1 hypothetical protein BDZ99DRAFT_493684 [Mytilinidion resinicola]
MSASCTLRVIEAANFAKRYPSIHLRSVPLPKRSRPTGARVPEKNAHATVQPHQRRRINNPQSSSAGKETETLRAPSIFRLERGGDGWESEWGYRGVYEGPVCTCGLSASTQAAILEPLERAIDAAQSQSSSSPLPPNFQAHGLAPIPSPIDLRPLIVSSSLEPGSEKNASPAAPGTRVETAPAASYDGVQREAPRLCSRLGDPYGYAPLALSTEHTSSRPTSATKPLRRHPHRARPAASETSPVAQSAIPRSPRTRPTKYRETSRQLAVLCQLSGGGIESRTVIAANAHEQNPETRHCSKPQMGDGPDVLAGFVQAWMDGLAVGGPQ